MKTKILLLPLLVVALSASADTPIQLSLVPDIALYPRTETVNGFSLGIWSENPQSSFTLGFINGSTGQSCGFSVGVVNYDQSYIGVQWGLLNLSTESFIGIQKGVVNVAEGKFEGMQWGLLNWSQDTMGLQLGWVNYAESLEGVQVGFVNVALNNPWFDEFPDKLSPVFPIVNWSF